MPQWEHCDLVWPRNPGTAAMQALFTCPTGQQLQVRRSCPHAKASRPPVCQARHTRHAAGSQQRLSQRQLTVTCAAAEEDAASLPTEDDAEPLSAQAPPKIRIKLKSYDKTLISESGTTIVDSAKATGAEVSGPVPLPTRIRKYTVLTSPHVNKDAREQFETRTHQRLIDIREFKPDTIDKLMALELPAGVDVQVKLL